ncbi:MAG: hypothetical protein WAM79_12210 [Candidatus Sulfotelmatobacter sp.]
MNKLPEVETAKALMMEAMDWSVMKWLREKKRVRAAADKANDALDGLNQEIKLNWPETLRSEYQSLSAKAAQISNSSGDNAILRKIKEGDDEARRARADAEETFDEAEAQLSTRLAREGCRKAIVSWELHEKAIAAAEALIRSN